MRNRVNVTLLAILVLAFVLRLISLDDHSLWYDEAFAVLFAEKGLSAMLYGTLTPVAGGASDIHPLLYYMTLNGWMAVFGQSPLVVRLWSVILGVAGIGMIYLIGRDLFGQRTGYAAALLTALFPFHVHYSQETRMYTLLALLLLLATWCYLKATKLLNTEAQRNRDAEKSGEKTPSQPSPAAPGDSSSFRGGIPDETQDGRSVLRPYTPSPFWRGGWGVRWGWWIAFGVCAGLAMYTQQLAAFYLAALGLMPLFTRKREHFIGMALGVAVAVVVYSPWLVNIPSQLQKVNSYYWVTQPDPGKIITTLYLFLTTYAEIMPPWSLIALVGSVFLITLALIQAVMVLRKPRRRKPHLPAESSVSPLLFVLWLWWMPVLLMWGVSQVQPVFLERSLITSAIMMYLFLAWFFTRSGAPLLIRGLMALIVIVQVAIGLATQYSLSTFPYSPVKELTACVSGQLLEGDVIIHMNKLTALPGLYYGRDLPQHYVGDYPGAPEDTLALPTQEMLKFLADWDVPAAAEGAKRVWFVTMQRAEQEYAAGGRPELTNALAWLEAHYTPAGKTMFNDLNLYLYSAAPGDAIAPCG